MVRLADNSYGKSDIRLTKVVRAGETHTLHELVVQIMMGGSFDRGLHDGRQLILHPHGYDEEHGLRLGPQARFRFTRGFCRDPRQALSHVRPGVMDGGVDRGGAVGAHHGGWRAASPLLHPRRTRYPDLPGEARTCGRLPRARRHQGTGGHQDHAVRVWGLLQGQLHDPPGNARPVSLRRESMRPGSTPPLWSRFPKCSKPPALRFWRRLPDTTVQASSRPSSPWVRSCCRGCPR